MTEPPNVAHGLFWRDEDGVERWMSTHQLLAHIRREIAEERKKSRRDCEHLAELLGRRLGEERAAMRREMQDLMRKLHGDTATHMDKLIGVAEGIKQYVEPSEAVVKPLRKPN
jgi:hypothetical protein